MSDDGNTETQTAGGPESLTYHVDGELVSADEASVAVNDRGFMYGDAAFETLRAYGGDLFRWGDHAERLANTCETLELDHGVADEDLRARIDETLTANDLEEAYVRLSITRGVQPGKLTPDPEVDPTVVVIAKPLPRGGRPDQGGEPRWDGPASLRTVDVRRPPENVMPSHLKTHNYLGGILARLELRGTDADEALLCDVDGNVAEGTTSNVFFVDDRALHTPSLEGPVLPGVTRQVVLELAREEGIPVDEGTFSPADVRAAEEVFITNTTGEVWPVASIDDEPIGPAGGDGPFSVNSHDVYPGGPVTRLLAHLFDDRIESQFY